MNQVAWRLRFWSGRSKAGGNGSMSGKLRSSPVTSAALVVVALSWAAMAESPSLKESGTERRQWWWKPESPAAKSAGRRHAMSCAAHQTHPSWWKAVSSASAVPDRPRPWDLAKSSRVRCESSAEDSSSLPPNPLWPSGISKQDVRDFVDEIMADPDINIAAIPDALERQIYATTVRLTLNAVYQALGQVHGLQFLAHEVQLRRFSEKTASQKLLFARPPPQDGTDDNDEDVGSIDEKLLDQVADRLLTNRAVNLRFVPDAVERQVYKNCLKLVFRLLDIVAATFRLTVCGHDISVQFQRTIKEQSLRRASAVAASSLTAVDVEALRELALEAAAGDDDDDDEEPSWWSRIWEPSRVTFMAQLNSTLYALILGIVDDLLANTELELLSDRIRIDIVPAATSREGASVAEKIAQLQQQVEAVTAPTASPKEQATTTSTVSRTPTDQQHNNAKVGGAFAAGVGLGAAAASIAWIAVGGGKSS